MATLTCTRGDALAASASYPPITLTVDIAANAPANLINTAAVSGGAETNIDNNSGSATTLLTLASAPAEVIPTLSTVGLAMLGVLMMLVAVVVLGARPGPPARQRSGRHRDFAR